MIAWLVALTIQTHLGEADVFPHVALPTDRSHIDQYFNEDGYAWAFDRFGDDCAELFSRADHPRAVETRYDFRDLYLEFDHSEEREASKTRLLLRWPHSVADALKLAAPLDARVRHLTVKPTTQGRELAYDLSDKAPTDQHARLILTLDGRGRCYEVELTQGS